METSSQIIGVVIALLNSIAIYVNNKAKIIDDLCNEAKVNIYDEYTHTMERYSNLLYSEMYQDDQLEDLINSMRKIQFSGNLDNFKLDLFTKARVKIQNNALIGFGISVLLILLIILMAVKIIPYCLLNNYIICAPIVILLYEVYLLWKVSDIERKVKNITDKYKNRDY